MGVKNQDGVGKWKGGGGVGCAVMCGWGKVGGGRGMRVWVVLLFGRGLGSKKGARCSRGEKNGKEPGLMVLMALLEPYPDASSTKESERFDLSGGGCVCVWKDLGI